MPPNVSNEIDTKKDDMANLKRVEDDVYSAASPSPLQPVKKARRCQPSRSGRTMVPTKKTDGGAHSLTDSGGTANAEGEQGGHAAGDVRDSFTKYSDDATRSKCIYIFICCYRSLHLQ